MPWASLRTHCWMSRIGAGFVDRARAHRNRPRRIGAGDHVAEVRRGDALVPELACRLKVVGAFPRIAWAVGGPAGARPAAGLLEELRGGHRREQILFGQAVTVARAIVLPVAP